MSPKKIVIKKSIRQNVFKRKIKQHKTTFHFRLQYYTRKDQVT